MKTVCEHELDSFTAAERIERLEGKLIQGFVEKMLEEIVAARKVPREGLVDSMPTFFENLAAGLKVGFTKEHELENSKLGAGHGKVRASQRSFSLDDILLEYRILSQVIFSNLKQNAHLSEDAEVMIHNAILTGLGNAVSTFNEFRAFAIADYKDREREKLLTVIDRAHEEFLDFLKQGDFPAFMTVGRKHRFTFVNQAFSKNFSEDAEGKYAAEVLGVEDAEQLLKALDKVYAQKSSLHEHNLSLQGHHYSIYLYFQKDLHGEAKGIIGMIHQLPDVQRKKDNIFIQVRH